MKKVSSVVWNFFDRIQEEGRCTSVLCQLCERTFKYYGNTTNLRIHLSKKHPIQWGLRESTKWERKETRHDDDDDETRTSVQSPSFSPTKTPGNNVRYALTIKPAEEEDSMPKIDIQRVDVLASKDDEDEQVVQHMHGSDEEWLDEDINNLFEGRHKTRVKQEFPSRRSVPYFQKSPRRQVLIESSPTKDEYSLFGEYIANKLRKIKSARTRGNIQQLVTTILWQSEYGYYEDIESVKQFLMYQPTLPQSSTVMETSEEKI